MCEQACIDAQCIFFFQYEYQEEGFFPMKKNYISKASNSVETYNQLFWKLPL